LGSYEFSPGRNFFWIDRLEEFGKIEFAHRWKWLFSQR
jgi:hypothetical protein